ncbi:hypothetical protein [Paenibacillus qinlingensis]|uniref:tRNA (Thr-GGU) A37 N-methylase n=1 Tax=Paenibacillus qinlingensis TaxID=1837343 RepID=A0ABU1NS23_9BACL|nr:hypothetical protein [Paenibacillus qinlingensis]MDR6550278.1 tRNA (Thr-GGU) A37 N-methylase [Paenibacillus qinlingensis]
MANNYKRFIQNQYEKAMSTASELISPRNEKQEEGMIELNPQYYDELQAIADMRHTTVQAVVNGIIVQYLTDATYGSTPISVNQKEDNPLLYLDGLCKLEV